MDMNEVSKTTRRAFHSSKGQRLWPDVCGAIPWHHYLAKSLPPCDRVVLRQVLGSLEPDQRLVLEELYGFDRPALTRAAFVARYGWTISQLDYVHSLALARLRKQLGVQLHGNAASVRAGESRNRRPANGRNDQGSRS